MVACDVGWEMGREVGFVLVVVIVMCLRPCVYVSGWNIRKARTLSRHGTQSEFVNRGLGGLSVAPCTAPWYM